MFDSSRDVVVAEDVAVGEAAPAPAEELAAKEESAPKKKKKSSKKNQAAPPESGGEGAGEPAAE